jgi:hypothetical protein
VVQQETIWTLGRNAIIWRGVHEESDVMKKQTNQVPKFANEGQEANWWASPTGREFLKQQSADNATSKQKGSRLVKKLSKPSSVQIALRLSEPDIAKAREIADSQGDRLPDTSENVGA